MTLDIAAEMSAPHPNAHNDPVRLRVWHSASRAGAAQVHVRWPRSSSSAQS
jgi:hypothetical protein